MKSFLKITIIILVSTFIWNCEDDQAVSDLIGTWLMVEEDFSYQYGIYSFTSKSVFDYTIDNFYGASILDIKKNSFYDYYNESDETYSHESNSYQMNDDFIYYTYIFDGTTYIDTIYYSFEDDILVLEMTSSYGSYTYNQEYRYEPYNGDLPPASWTAVLEEDNYEVDNTASTATMLTIAGSEQTHTIIEDDTDWFKFDATAGTTYKIQVRANMDNLLTLFGSDGQTEIEEDDENDYGYDLDIEGLEAVIVWTCATTGTYYFRVEGYNSRAHGYYTAAVGTTTMIPVLRIKNPGNSAVKPMAIKKGSDY